MGRNSSKLKKIVDSTDDESSSFPSAADDTSSWQPNVFLEVAESSTRSLLKSPSSPSQLSYEIERLRSQIQFLGISSNSPQSRPRQPYFLQEGEESFKYLNGHITSSSMPIPQPRKRRDSLRLITAKNDNHYKDDYLAPVKPTKIEKEKGKRIDRKVAKATGTTAVQPLSTPYSPAFKYDHYGNLLSFTVMPVEGKREHTSILAIDCEMVGIGSHDDSVLARVSIVNRYGYCIYNSFVKPKEPVTDYRTDRSGVRKEDLVNAPLHDAVVREVQAILKGKLVIGHSVHNDFEVLEIQHPWNKIRDTELYYRELMKETRRVSLRKLCLKFLQMKIQEGEHSSIIDAQVTMALYLREESNWETKYANTMSTTVTPRSLLTWRQMPVFPRQADLFVKSEFVHPIKVDVAYGSSDQYLDTQFRILREDFMKPLRQGIQDYHEWSIGKKKVTPKTVRIFENVQMKIYKNSKDANTTKGFQTLIFPVLQREIDMSRMTEDSKFLINGSLLLLAPNPSIGKPDFRKVKLAIVVRKEDDEFRVRDGILDVNFVADGPTWSVDSKTTFTILESVGFFEAYRHALDCLQLMYFNQKFRLGKYILDPTIPFNTIHDDVNNFDFTKLIIKGNRNQAVTHAGFPSADALGLSPCQFEAYHSALTKEVAVIQGPPGTGKTFIALAVIKFFLCNEHVLNKRPLVVVSNTNHSLDHLLEKVILYAREMSGSFHKGNDLVLRFGGRSKSELVETVSYFGKIKRLNEKLDVQNRIQSTKRKLEMLKDMSDLGLQIVSDLLIAKTRLKSAKGSLRSSNKTSKLYSAEEKNELAHEFSVYEIVVSILEIFKMNPTFQAEEILVRGKPLLKNLNSKVPALIALELKKLRKLEEEWKHLKNCGSEADILRCARVLGMTITGSAKNKIKFLERLKPELVIVEEAAHVVEATVVAGLTEFCRRLILIGDHNQLRPSTADFELTKANHLDVSMMERFVRNAERKGVRTWTQLDIQRRMRPEISKLIHPTIYPTLHDHPDVFKYPNVQGMTKNLFFIDHDQGDSQEDASTSFVNLKEANFLVNLCHYLVGQGNKPEKISIITTYLGQRYKLERLMANASFGRSVRVCCVDGFQGEENEIILLSLVRSNDRGNIGFLSTNNRVCVALSRARQGLYIVGNMTRLAARSQTWCDIKQTLTNERSIGREIVLKCKTHGEIISVGMNGSQNTFSSQNFNRQGCLCQLIKPKPKPLVTVERKKKSKAKKLSTVVEPSSVVPSLMAQKKTATLTLPPPKDEPPPAPLMAQKKALTITLPPPKDNPPPAPLKAQKKALTLTLPPPKDNPPPAPLKAQKKALTLTLPPPKDNPPPAPLKAQKKASTLSLPKPKDEPPPAPLKAQKNALTLILPPPKDNPPPAPLKAQKKAATLTLPPPEAEIPLAPEVNDVVKIGCGRVFACGHPCAAPSCDKSTSHINYQCKHTCRRSCSAGHKCSSNHVCYRECHMLVNCGVPMEKVCGSCGVHMTGACSKLYPYLGKRNIRDQKDVVCKCCKKKERALN